MKGGCLHDRRATGILRLMQPSSSRVAEYKRAAALAAVAEVRDGMWLGLGTGSTAAFAVEEIGARLTAGTLRDVTGVATSEATATLARRLGIPLAAHDSTRALDLAIDGADEVDPEGNLIKGGGGALLREKAVERRARRLVIVVDEGKLSARLGTAFALPVEVERSAAAAELAYCATLGCRPVQRGAEAAPFVTDNGNVILDCRFAEGIADADALAALLDARPGVRAHGLFLHMAHEVIFAGPMGLRHWRRS